MSAIRISIADNSESTRLIYKRVLETQSEFEVVGLAADGEEALEQAMALVPDVVVLDIVMPKINGIQVAQQIMKRHPDTGIVIVSSYAEPAYVSAIMESGAKRKAYVLKISLAEISELIRIVQPVANGETVLDATISQRLLKLYDQIFSSPLCFITEEEISVLQLMLEGHSTSFMTHTLEMNPGEIAANAASAYEKLGVVEQTYGDRISSAVQALVSQVT